MSEGALAELESTLIGRGALMRAFTFAILKGGAVAPAGLASLAASGGGLVGRGSADTPLGAFVEHVAGVLARREAEKVETKGALRGSLGVRGGIWHCSKSLAVLAALAAAASSGVGLVGPVFCEGLKGRTGAEDIEPVELERAGLLDVENADLGLMNVNVSYSIQ